MSEKNKKENKLGNVLDLRTKNKEPQLNQPVTQKKKTGKWGIKKILLIIGLALTLSLGIQFYAIYELGSTNILIRLKSKIIPYPAARVDFNLVTYNQFLSDLDSYKLYYKVTEEQDFTSEEGQKEFEKLKKDLLETLIEDEIIKKEAKKINLAVSEEEIDQEYKQLSDKLGAENEESLKKIIKDYYNWDVKTFRSKIKATLYRKKMEAWVAKDPELNKDKKAKAEEILKRIESGEDFAALAKEFSNDPSAVDGGKMDWIEKNSYSEDYEKVAFSLEKGQVSKVVVTDFGFYIIKIEDKKEDQINVRHILIKPTELSEWLKTKKDEYQVKRYLPLTKIKSQ